jgi:hypothetical protein
VATFSTRPPYHDLGRKSPILCDFRHTSRIAGCSHQIVFGAPVLQVLQGQIGYLGRPSLAVRPRSECGRVQSTENRSSSPQSLAAAWRGSGLLLAGRVIRNGATDVEQEGGMQSFTAERGTGPDHSGPRSVLVTDAADSVSGHRHGAAPGRGPGSQRAVRESPSEQHRRHLQRICRR